MSECERDLASAEGASAEWIANYHHINRKARAVVVVVVVAAWLLCVANVNAKASGVNCGRR